MLHPCPRALALPLLLAVLATPLPAQLGQDGFPVPIGELAPESAPDELPEHLAPAQGEGSSFSNRESGLRNAGDEEEELAPLGISLFDRTVAAVRLLAPGALPETPAAADLNAYLAELPDSELVKLFPSVIPAGIASHGTRVRFSDGAPDRAELDTLLFLPAHGELRESVRRIRLWAQEVARPEVAQVLEGAGELLHDQQISLRLSLLLVSPRAVPVVGFLAAQAEVEVIPLLRSLGLAVGNIEPSPAPEERGVHLIEISEQVAQRALNRIVERNGLIDNRWKPMIDPNTGERSELLVQGLGLQLHDGGLSLRLQGQLRKHVWRGRWAFVGSRGELPLWVYLRKEETPNHFSLAARLKGSTWTSNSFWLLNRAVQKRIPGEVRCALYRMGPFLDGMVRKELKGRVAVADGGRLEFNQRERIVFTGSRIDVATNWLQLDLAETAAGFLGEELPVTIEGLDFLDDRLQMSLRAEPDRPVLQAAQGALDRLAD